MNIDLSVVIVSFNTKKLLRDCIDSVIKYTKGIDYEITVIDNASIDGLIEEIEKLASKNKFVKLIKNKKNLGFAAANNQGTKVAGGRYILFLNSDTKVLDNVLGEMVEWMDKNSKVGVATCALRGLDGKLQATGGFFPNLLSVFSWMTIQDLPFVDYFIKPFHPLHSKSFFSRGEDFYGSERELDWVTGAFLLTRKKILDDVGGWDENYFMYVEEVDLCFRIKKQGWEVRYLPDWSIVHKGGGSSKATEFPLLSEYRGIKKFYKKFYPSWQYPFLRLFLKVGSLGRIALFGILEGKEATVIYVRAFQEA